MAFPNATANWLALQYFISTPNRKGMSFTEYRTSSPAGAAIDGTTIKAVATAFHDTLGNLLKVLMDEKTQIVQCHARFRGITDDGVFDGWSANGIISGTAIVTTDATDAEDAEIMPDYAALVIQRRTGKAGRNKYGRVFIPGITEDANANGFLQEEYYTGANAVAAFLSTDQTLGGSTWHARHWDRKTNSQEVVVQARVMQRLGTRRDRTPTGPNLPT